MKLIDRFEQRGHFVTFYPSFAEAFGGIKEALLIGKMIYWAEYADSEWMTKSLKQVELETGLTHKELRRCRERFEENGWLETQFDHKSHLLRFKLNKEAVVKAWEEYLPKGHVPTPSTCPPGQVLPAQRADAARARDYSSSDLYQNTPLPPKGGEVVFDASASEKNKTSIARGRSGRPKDPQAILDRMPPNVFLSCNPQFKASFLRWITHGLELRYPITVPQFEIHWEKCALLGVEKAARRIKFSIEHGKNNLDDPPANGSRPLTQGSPMPARALNGTILRKIG
jgi:hypothetical protein